ncbi:hypothetical protein SEA_YEET_95 [Mycobacterium phage Yeet]|uniref:Uncharacterized protein n=4 Tax=Omegavirus TaxID=1623292 RepID=A0A3S9UAX7_9CAUD|nr:HNH endonuclease [Mycobacterium phage Redno2]YP_008410495.1 HNH endonuclease [Mycobacterium phage Wanda]YP_009018098.1 HNH endonuclease [Mycobacterium phage Thibault]YP_009124055.1 HNH endonuclease [Mycobacterium phage Minerva]YP_009590952.1 HNH endonuclease [Mycobacterium phage Optimus]YP_009636275.1 HNH endonuclease [Mycobacterium phage Baka]ATN88911.1 hypothetical protein SEA_DMPSTRDIVER_104 [Mycobacterium phage DmpstrDiver]ATN89816.1 hypothetical protein SEA_KLEIN_103 [Mycobacterium p
MRTCTREDCERKHHARGYCKFHYKRWHDGVDLDRPYGPGRLRFFDWAMCGTPAQYKKHLRHNIPMCEPCRKAESRRQQDRP